MKWDSKVTHIWQCILPLKTLTVEVEEICIKRLKTYLQSFWMAASFWKCFYSMQRLCCIYPSANNLCSKGTLCLWQKLNNLQNSMLSMIFRGEKDGERKWQLQIPESIVVASVVPGTLNAHTNWRVGPPKPLSHSQHRRYKRPDTAEPPFTSALKSWHIKMYDGKNPNMTIVWLCSTIVFEWFVQFPFCMIKF